MDLIVAVDENWGIGCDGKLLTSIPEDMKYFKEKTEGTAVVMGHSTLKSLPHSKPLKNRENIVLSRNIRLSVEGATVCHSLEDVLKEAQKHNEVFVIGGQEVYELLLPYCKNAYVTKIYSKFPADKFFPNLDKLENWSIKQQSETKSHNGVDFVFTIYENSESL